MPALPSSSQYSMLGQGAGQSDFVRLPDGSLIMAGRPKPVAPMGMLDRLRAAASQYIPTFGQKAEPSVPWWIAQPQVADPVAAAPTPVAANAPSAPGQQDWNAIAREASHEDALASQLGDFSKRVMSSPELIEGKWGINPFK